MQVRYESEGGGDAGTIALGAIQLRAGSERLVADGRQLVRDVDYTIDYELGVGHVHAIPTRSSRRRRR